MTQPRSRQRELKAQFDEAHAAGMASLKSRNYSGLDEALRRERAIIEEQALLIAEQRRTIAGRRPAARPAAPRKRHRQA